MSIDLYDFTDVLLKAGNSLSKVVEITGLDLDTVKSIDMNRMLDLYTTTDSNGNKELIKPDNFCKVLGVYDFKLPKEKKYFTTIVDIDSWNIIYVAPNNDKSVVSDFIDYVGEDWMKKIEAVTCNIDSDFQETITNRFPNIKIVYDYKNIQDLFQNKVVNKVVKDEIKRLEQIGNTKGIADLKNSRYILPTSIKSTKDSKNKTNNDSYEEFVDNNKLLIIINFIKSGIESTYDCDSQIEIAEILENIIDLCLDSNNKHFLWFKNFIVKNFDKIIAHGTYKISNDLLEEFHKNMNILLQINAGLPLDDYYLLKILDMSKNIDKVNLSIIQQDVLNTI